MIIILAFDEGMGYLKALQWSRETRHRVVAENQLGNIQEERKK